MNPCMYTLNQTFQKGDALFSSTGFKAGAVEKEKKVKKRRKTRKEKQNDRAFQLDRPAIKTDTLIVCIHIGKVLQIFQA